MEPKLQLLYKFKDHSGKWHDPGEIWKVSYAAGEGKGYVYISNMGAYDAALINMITKRLDGGV